MFDGITGDLIKAQLRSGNVYSLRKAVRFFGPIFKKYKKMIKKIPVYLRADSDFAKPGIYKIAEEHDILYTIKLKANARLYDLAKPLEEKLVQKTQDNLYEKQVVCGQLNYQAGS